MNPKSQESNNPKEEVVEEANESKTSDDMAKLLRSVTRRYRSPRNGFDVLGRSKCYGQNNPLNYRSNDYRI
ncbi:MAG: hypothetical protein R2822_02570 [Spirosomataceae bacterium]